MPAAERKQETGCCMADLHRRHLHNWPDRADAPTRKGADVDLVSLWSSTVDDTGTEGQVGHHDELRGRDGIARSGRIRAGCGERTGGRGHRLVADQLAAGRGRRTASTA